MIKVIKNSYCTTKSVAKLSFVLAAVSQSAVSMEVIKSIYNDVRQTANNVQKVDFHNPNLPKDTHNQLVRSVQDLNKAASLAKVRFENFENKTKNEQNNSQQKIVGNLLKLQGITHNVAKTTYKVMMDHYYNEIQNHAKEANQSLDKHNKLLDKNARERLLKVLEALNGATRLSRELHENFKDQEKQNAPYEDYQKIMEQMLEVKKIVFGATEKYYKIVLASKENQKKAELRTGDTPPKMTHPLADKTGSMNNRVSKNYDNGYTYTYFNHKTQKTETVNSLDDMKDLTATVRISPKNQSAESNGSSRKTQLLQDNTGAIKSIREIAGHSPESILKMLDRLKEMGFSETDIFAATATK